MRIMFALIAVTLLAVAGPALAQDLSTDKGKLSYAVGWGQANDLKRTGEDLDTEAIIAGLRDSMAGNDAQVPLAEMQQLTAALQERLRQRQLEQLQELAQQNQVKAEQFLEENRSKTGIVELPSGVQYRIIEEGEGPRPGLDSQVQLHARSSKVDGIEIDSSFARGVPIEIRIDETLPGWQEVLPLMKQGSTWQIFVPPELAFGQRGQPPVVGPNEALMFDLKLLEILE